MSLTEFLILLRNSSFLTLPGSFVVIQQTWNEFQIISGWFFKSLMPSAIQLTISCLDGNQQYRLTISNTNKKMTDVMKEKLNPLVEDTKESIVNQNSFRVLSILYITNFCETRKVNYSATRVPFLLLNFRKSRKCALN